MDSSSTSGGAEPGAREPAWRVGVAVWLFAHALFGSLPDRAPVGLDPGGLDPGRWAGDPDLSPRALRGWPSIGELRALAIAEARWEHPDEGPPLYLSDVEGIGEASERAVRAWLEASEEPREVVGQPGGT